MSSDKWLKKGYLNLKSKTLRNHTIAIFKEKVAVYRPISRFSFPSKLQKEELGLNDLNSREADFVSS